MENITEEKWVQLIESDDHFTILDVRTPGECAEGIQKDALILNFMDSKAFIDGLSSLDKTKTHYVYCRSGNRSGQACMIMDQMGFEKTYNLLGGMINWKGDKVYP